MKLIRDHYKGEPESAWMLERAVDLKMCSAYELPDRPVYGPPLTTMHMSCGPTNEQGRAVSVCAAGERSGICGGADKDGASGLPGAAEGGPGAVAAGEA